MDQIAIACRVMCSVKASECAVALEDEVGCEAEHMNEWTSDVNRESE